MISWLESEPSDPPFSHSNWALLGATQQKLPSPTSFPPRGGRHGHSVLEEVKEKMASMIGPV